MEKDNARQRVLSGIQPTGTFTLGNYLGAVRNWPLLQDEYDCVYMIADQHSITVKQEPKLLRQRTLEAGAMLLASGIDPDKSLVFIQSQNPAHSQLSWALSCYTMFGELSRMTQYKDKSAKHADNINAGLFTYPVLMAADILIYNAHKVPVGADQKQHVELARDIATRFNNLYGETFVLPENLNPKVGAKIMSLQEPTKKMSKSDTNEKATILLLDDETKIMKKFKSAVTDSENCVRYDAQNKPGISNLMGIYNVFTGKSFEEIEKEFDGLGYGAFKEAVGTSVVEGLRPFQTKYNDIISDKAYLQKVLTEGAEKSYAYAMRTVRKVYKKIGFVQFDK